MLTPIISTSTCGGSSLTALDGYELLKSIGQDISRRVLGQDRTDRPPIWYCRRTWKRSASGHITVGRLEMTEHYRQGLVNVSSN